MATGEEGEDGIKVVGREEDMAGEEAEVGTEVVGEVHQGEWTGDGEEVGWRGEAGVHQVGWTGAGEGGEEVAWMEVWRVVEEAGVVDLTEDAELPWTEGGGLETGEGVAVSQEVEEEDSTRLYHCSAISRRCPIH